MAMKLMAICFSCLIVVISLIQNAGCNLTCLSCDDSINPRDCQYTLNCGSHQECYTTAYVTSSGTIRYRTGCRDKNQCSDTDTSVKQNGVREVKLQDSDSQDKDVRQTGTDIIVCSGCCNGTLCNTNLCVLDGATIAPPSSRGPICYTCGQQNDPSSCHQIKQCGLNQECLLMRYESQMGNDLMYKTDCISKQTCAERLSIYRTVVASTAIGKRSGDQGHCALKCCNTDLCNADCSGDRVMFLLNTSLIHVTFPSTPSSPTTTTTVPTVATSTPDPTQTQGSCRDVHASEYCQSYKSLCTSEYSYQRDWALKYCKHTCNMCSHSSSVDNSDCHDVWPQQNCIYWKYWCTHPQGDNYNTLKNCKRTCNNC